MFVKLCSAVEVVTVSVEKAQMFTRLVAVLLPALVM
jgi:hypothetical protein